MAADGPDIGPDVTLNEPAWIHPSAHIYGNVVLEKGSSVWINVAIRCESGQTIIGEKTNIQDFVMIHGAGQKPSLIGKNCSITHHVTLHGCSVGDNCLIGIGATIMDRCVIGENSIVAGGSFLKEDTIIPPNSVVMGTPGKVVRTRNNAVANRMNALAYYRNALAYRDGYHREWGEGRYAKDVAEEMRELQAEIAELRKTADTKSA